VMHFYASTACATAEALCFRLVCPALHDPLYQMQLFICPGVCPMPSVFRFLCKNVEHIWMKFVGDKHHHQQINVTKIFGKIITGQGRRIRQKIWIDISWCFIVMSNRCVANEFTHFTSHIKIDSIVHIILC